MGNRNSKKSKPVICPPGCIPAPQPAPVARPTICPQGCVPAPIGFNPQVYTPLPQPAVQTPDPQPRYTHDQQPTMLTQTIDSRITQLTPPPPQTVQIVQQPYQISQQMYSQTIDSQISQLTPPPPQTIVQNPTVQIQTRTIEQIVQPQTPQPMPTQIIVIRPSSNNNPCPPGCVPIVTMSNTSRSRSRSSKDSRNTNDSRHTFKSS